jgi:hypothetical protein
VALLVCALGFLSVGVVAQVSDVDANRDVTCSHCSAQTSFTSVEGWTLPEYHQVGGPTNHFHCNGNVKEKNTFDDAQPAVVKRFSDSDSGDPLHVCDAVLADANNPVGAGGLGFRHYRIRGANKGGGGIRFQHPPTSELWLRWYERYSRGFDWTQRVPPAWSKELRDDGPGVILDWLNGQFCIWKSRCQVTDDRRWSDYWDRPSDGSWHCLEVYMNQRTGAASIGIDGKEVAKARSGRNLGAVPFSRWGASNQASPTEIDSYTDYDDWAASSTQRIGCFPS